VYNVSITNTNRGLALMPRWGTSSIYNVLLENIDIQTQYFRYVTGGKKNKQRVIGIFEFCSTKVGFVQKILKCRHKI
jgi:hypothetical protein